MGICPGLSRLGQKSMRLELGVRVASIHRTVERMSYLLRLAPRKIDLLANFRSSTHNPVIGATVKNFSVSFL